MEYTTVSRKLGFYSATLTGVLIIAYAITLSLGFLSLSSQDEPIGDPYVWILEVLILVMMPVMVVLMSAIHVWTPVGSRIFSLIALVFMGLLCVTTCSVHFLILTLGRQPEIAAQAWAPLFLEFKWPSFVYALDILGWDIFFPLSMLMASFVFRGSRLKNWIRVAMVGSGVLSLAGLFGVLLGDMRFRNIGIAGYVGVFMVVCILLVFHFLREFPEKIRQ